MQTSHVLIGVVFISLCIVSATFAGCISSTTTDESVPVQQTLSPVSSTATAAPQDDLTLVESHVEAGEYGETYVAGTVRSNVDKQFTYVQVTVVE